MKVLDGVTSGAVVVAHPDDEALWFAGLPIRFPEIEWTIECCTIPRRDPERSYCFYEACRRLGATGHVLPHVEPEPASDALRGLDMIRLSPYGVVATHNALGEYGHVHHRAVHRYVRDHFAGPILHSGYGMEDGPEVIGLSPGERVRKLAAIMAYDHTPIGTNCTKGDALLARYGKRYDLWTETYHVH